VSTFEVTKLAPALGAEVRGLDPTGRLDDAGQKQLRALFDEHAVLLFRGIDLDRPYQQYLAELVRGEDDLSDERIAADAAAQGRFYISNKIENAAAPFGMLLYHSDGMWSTSPFEVLSLYGEEVDPPVPPTMFASTTHAWDTLPEQLRARVEDRSAVQVPGPESFTHRRKSTDVGTLVQPVRDKAYSVTTPIAYRHPRTGRTMLFVSQQMTSHIVGLSSEESEQLLEALFSHMYAPENTWQHEWLQGDLLLWDNLACQHARPDVDTAGSTRTLRKVGWPMPTAAAMPQVREYQRIK
jgi:alpha-ketoglutarate-dependent taurine dioxygenase